MAHILHDIDRLNGQFDNTINDIRHKFHAYTTSDNECYTYSQMLWQEDYMQFFQAMEVNIDDHETCKHWTLMLRKMLEATSFHLASTHVLAKW